MRTRTRHYRWALAALATVLLAAGCTLSSNGAGDDAPGREREVAGYPVIEQPDPEEIPDGRTATIVAQEKEWTVKPGLRFKAWTYNGTIPGTPLRVTEGETVQVKLVNRLPEPVSIHWHGVPVPNAMDGVPGVTQNAVAPGKAFLYEFPAIVPGTYWYHSHQDSVDQVDRGLYGTLVVEPRNLAVRYDRDYTLVLDEWLPDPAAGEGGMAGMPGMGGMNMGGMDHSGMGGMKMGGGMTMGEAGQRPDGNAMEMSAYTTFSINGKAYPETEPLVVRQGERVKLRLVNAGYLTHRIHVHGHDVKVTHADGQPIANPPAFRDRLIAVAPGERYEIEFTADHPGRWLIECHGEMAGTPDMKVELVYAGSEGAPPDGANAAEALPELDLTSYGEAAQALFSPGDRFDREFDLKLGAGMGARQGRMEMLYTINGKAYPETEPLPVKKGDRVKVRLTNVSDVDHPMHLHGHFFQVLSKDGKPLTGSPLVKDTLNVRPGESYEVAFVADNPGDWMFHCHDLHHAAGGMVTEVRYEGFEPAFTPDPRAGNKPE